MEIYLSGPLIALLALVSVAQPVLALLGNLCSFCHFTDHFSGVCVVQRTGLKYFEDLQKRIPRKEVAIIEADVREAAIDVLQCRDKPDVGSLFCRAVGR